MNQIKTHHQKKTHQKSFDRVRRSKIFHIGREQCGITLITFGVIEPGKMTTGAVHEKTEHLDKMVYDRDSLFIFPHRTKLTFDDRNELNTFQIPREKAQSGTTCDSFIGGLNCTNTLLLFSLKFGNSTENISGYKPITNIFRQHEY